MVDALVHPSGKPADLSSLLPAFPPSTKWVVIFFTAPHGKGPQAVVSSAEAFSNSMDLTNHIFHADDVKFNKRLSSQCVICQGNSLFADFAINTLVDQPIH